MKFYQSKTFAFLATQVSVHANIFLHSPRGSQNRINEKTAQNTNPNRLFWANHNSDFNRRGGYNVGEKTPAKMESEDDQYSMQYFMSSSPEELEAAGASSVAGKSYLTVEWTQLLGCGLDEDGDQIHDCEIVIQSLCQDDLQGEATPSSLEDPLTIKNGFHHETVNYVQHDNDLDDPKGLCFVDNGPRDLPSQRVQIPKNQPSSIEFCQNHCKNKEFIYAGISGRNCWCGQKFGKYGLAQDQSECNVKCQDQQKTNNCGGKMRNNIYLSGFRPNSPNSPNGEPETQSDKNLRKQATNTTNLGLHESWESFERCPSYFESFGKSSGPRSGLECRHERETYPVNYATQWTDVAFFTTDRRRCNQARNGANRREIFECVEFYSKGLRKHKSKFSDQESCEENGGQWLGFYKYKHLRKDLDQETCQGEDLVWGRPMNWQTLSNDKVTKPSCLELHPRTSCQPLPRTRHNVLSIAEGTNESPRFKWALPSYEKNQRCVLRLRMFIRNPDESPISNYNKEVNIGSSEDKPIFLALAQKHSADNTIVYEDRSHIFKLLRRPKTIPAAQTIHNIVVRGKRGNIVQTYPAVEYDFVPNNLKIRNGEAVQFQWTGSNTHDNDGVLSHIRFRVTHTARKMDRTFR